MTASFNAMALDDDATEWTDEFDWTPVGQSMETDIHGGLVVEYISPNADGQPMTLYLGWIRKSVLDQLTALRDADAQGLVPVVLPDGRAFDVVWNHGSGKPVDAVPVQNLTAYSDDDYFDVTLNLIINKG